MIANLAQADLHLQMGPVLNHRTQGRPAFRGHYRFARANGWHCGCWHKNVEQAVECIELKLWRA